MSSSLVAVRVAVLGDANSGKSSFIWRILANRETLPNQMAGQKPRLPEQLPSVLSEITIKSMFEDSRDSVIIDTPSIMAEVEMAHVLNYCTVAVLCVSREKISNIERLRQYWVPFFKKSIGENSLCVVICGTKMDLNESQCDSNINQWRYKIDQTIEDLQHQYGNSFYFLHEEISSLNDSNIENTIQIIYDNAVDAVFQLYDLKTKKLRSSCVDALTAIFGFCDTDKDNFLSDKELSIFQRDVFQIELTPEEIEKAKQKLRTEIPSSVTSSGISLEGFLYLHEIFIRNREVGNVWMTLRHFGFDETTRSSQTWAGTSSHTSVESGSLPHFDDIDATSSKWSVASNAGSQFSPEESNGSLVIIQSDQDEITSNNTTETSFVVVEPLLFQSTTTTATTTAALNTSTLQQSQLLQESHLLQQSQQLQQSQLLQQSQTDNQDNREQRATSPLSSSSQRTSESHSSSINSSTPPPTITSTNTKPSASSSLPDDSYYQLYLIIAISVCVFGAFVFVLKRRR